MPSFKLVIFDCDGTLTDSEALNNQALLAVLHEDGLTQYDMDYAYHHWVGTTVSGILANIEAESGRKLSADVIARYMSRVQAMMSQELKPVAGAAHLVAVCARRMPVCVASNGERKNVIESLRLTGLLPFFKEEHIFTKGQVPRPKPWPDLFLFAAEAMGVAPQDCLVIEDSPTGVRAAVAAGMTVWGFTGSAHNPQTHILALQQAGAQNIFARLAQMADLLED